MIDPFAITRYDRTQAELEELWVFCLAVAGKKATMIARMVEDFLANCGHEGTPFDRIRTMVANGTLVDHMRRARVGKYGLISQGLKETLDRSLDLRTCTVHDLEGIYGVGPKTARFFLLHSRKDAKVAVIDTHMLKYLRAIGHKVPMGMFPTGQVYARLEQAVLAEVDRLGMSQADFDLQVWSWYASGENEGAPPFAAGAPKPKRVRRVRKTKPKPRPKTKRETVQVPS